MEYFHKVESTPPPFVLTGYLGRVLCKYFKLSLIFWQSKLNHFLFVPVHSILELICSLSKKIFATFGY